MKKFLLILILSSLACGAPLATVNRGDALSNYDNTSLVTETSTVVKMVVVAPEGLNIRASHSETSDDIGDLFPGDIVTCREIYTGGNAGDGIWCLHELGWSNVRWMELVTDDEAK